MFDNLRYLSPFRVEDSGIVSVSDRFDGRLAKWTKLFGVLPQVMKQMSSALLAARFDVSFPDEAELEEVYNTERHLLYVACTRARDFLLVTGVKPGSEFLGDLKLQ